jgi:glycosyltransferase involved in cell wall biosynthesis
LHILDLRRFLEERKPGLVVLSNGVCFPPIELAELFIGMKLPFATISQANHVDWWPDDSRARQCRTVLSAASRCYFVSHASREMAEKHIGCRLSNAEVVRNPFNVPYGSAPAWPTEGDCLRMACVARLHPASKGQDLLLEALAQPPWDSRNWTLALYGDGPNKETLLRLTERLHLGSRVEFRGHVDDVAGIWAESHLLVLPSRYEGLPLVLVEAMLCGRAALVTNVGGNSEVVSDGTTGFIAESPTVAALQRVLERAWMQRSELQRMGEAASRSIRESVPVDPVGVFVSKLRALMTTMQAAGRPPSRS